MAENNKTNNILVIAPFPPPVHGFSVAMENFALEMEKYSSVISYNLAGRSPNYFLRKIQSLCLTFFACIKIIGSSFRQHERIAIGCNGGLGVILTMLLILSCRIARKNATIHHHSFNYINNYSFFMSIIVALSNNKIKHIFLSNSMVKKFQLQYSNIKSDVICNAYMVNIKNVNKCRNSLFQVGMLSNLCKEKGLFHFLEAARKSYLIGLEINFVLAGPIDDLDDLTKTKKYLNDLPNLEYLGPLYGKEKENFYENLDTFIFPTDYKNEAQPIVLYEAMSASVPIISIKRGCISDQVGQYFKTFPTLDEFNSEIISCLSQLIDMSIEERNILRSSTLEFFISQHQNSINNISKIGIY